MSLRWNDTRGDTVLATRAITEMICDGVATIFGPEGPCHVEAIVSQARNIPMISYVSFFSPKKAFHRLRSVSSNALKNNQYMMMCMFQKCSDYMASSIPTFARTEPPDTQVRYLHHLRVH